MAGRQFQELSQQSDMHGPFDFLRLSLSREGVITRNAFLAWLGFLPQFDQFSFHIYQYLTPKSGQCFTIIGENRPEFDSLRNEWVMWVHKLFAEQELLKPRQLPVSQLV